MIVIPGKVRLQRKVCRGQFLVVRGRQVIVGGTRVIVDCGTGTEA